MHRFTFKKSQRLVTEADFKAVLAYKCCAENDLLRLYIRPNDLGRPRLGISISKKYGKAVVRNRLKRLAREAFRQAQYDIPSGYDYLLIFPLRWSKKTQSEPPPDPSTIDFDTVRQSLLRLAETAARKSRQKKILLREMPPVSNKGKLMRIGEAAAKAGVTRQQLQYYIMVGLLDATEVTDTGRRLFDDKAVERIKLIKKLNQSGYPLRAIRDLFLERNADSKGPV